MLYLKWEKSENSTYVYRYRVTINGYSIHTLSTTISWWWWNLEPGRNYTVQIEAVCWYYHSYRKWSAAYTDEIQTLRKLFVIPQLPTLIFQVFFRNKCSWFLQNSSTFFISQVFLKLPSHARHIPYRFYQTLKWWHQFKTSLTFLPQRLQNGKETVKISISLTRDTMEVQRI